MTLVIPSSCLFTGSTEEYSAQASLTFLKNVEFFLSENIKKVRKVKMWFNIKSYWKITNTYVIKWMNNISSQKINHQPKLQLKRISNVLKFFWWNLAQIGHCVSAKVIGPNYFQIEMVVGRISKYMVITKSSKCLVSHAFMIN